jgi:hypothetical protein
MPERSPVDTLVKKAVLFHPNEIITEKLRRS